MAPVLRSKGTDNPHDCQGASGDFLPWPFGGGVGESGSSAKMNMPDGMGLLGVETPVIQP